MQSHQVQSPVRQRYVTGIFNEPLAPTHRRGYKSFERLARASASPTRSDPEGSSRNESRLGRCQSLTSSLKHTVLQARPASCFVECDERANIGTLQPLRCKRISKPYVPCIKTYIEPARPLSRRAMRKGMRIGHAPCLSLQMVVTNHPYCIQCFF